MKKIALLLLLTCSVAFSQKTQVTKLGDFSTLKVYSGLKIELVKSEISKIEISGSKADQVSIKNKNGTLKVSLKFPDGFSYEDIKIVLHYHKAIDIIDANEGSLIFSNQLIKQQNLELKVQEGARIESEIQTKYLTIKTVSGGIINIHGSTQNQTIEANTGGIYKGYDLKSTSTTATSSSGAVVKVSVIEMLDANVNLGGTILYKGNPEELKTNKIMGGKIKKEI